MADISLSKAVRSNLLSLKGTADMMATTQNRLSTGNKVNSALDNPSSWFTAQGLSNRASDLGSLLDSMANGVKTLEAADNGLSAMTKTLESMQSTLRQARQDKSFQTASYEIDTSIAASADITISGGAVAGDVVVNADKTEKTAVPVGLVDGKVVLADTGKQFTVSDGTTATLDITLTTGDTLEMIAEKINTATTTAGNGITAAVTDGELVLTSLDADAITIAQGTTTGGLTVMGFGADAQVAKTADEMVTSINNNAALEGKVRASNDNGKLRLENQSTQKLEVEGAVQGGKLTGGTTNKANIEGNSVRAGLADQFNELRDQLDKLADDASFNGINLLRGDKLAITFNETGTSSIDIQTKDGDTINSANLGVSTTLEASDLDSDDAIDAELGKLKSALGDVRSQASSFGSNLSIVQNRQSFTDSMINTLESGAGNLTLADMNTEAANLLALQTRQSLSQNSLSLASQADQSILQLLR
jgi:flagellin-like hook-associated protein FlgL